MRHTRGSSGYRTSSEFAYVMKRSVMTGGRIAVTLPNKISGNQYQNPYARNADYGNCDFDLRHNVMNSFVYESPKFSNRAVNAVVGAWQLGFLVSAHTGRACSRFARASVSNCASSFSTC